MSPGTGYRLTDMDTVELGPAAERLAELVARVPDGELDNPTPCPSYRLGDLIEHVGGLALAFTAAARKDGGEYADQQASGDASRLPGDWRERIPGDLRAMAAAWRAPGAWTGTTRIAGSDMPAEIAGLAAVDELVVHGWDVASAAGQPYRAEQELLTAAQAFLGHFASPDAPAGPDVPFGPSRQVADDAPMLDRVLSLAGRDPGWSPARS